MIQQITGLRCRNFRSYLSLSLDFDSRFIIFFGDNGAGKTNILEALSLFSASKGLRKANLFDLTNEKSLFFQIELDIKKNEYSHFLSLNSALGKRSGKIDFSPIKSLYNFEDLIWLLWIAPNMDGIFSGSLSDRRSFLDHLVSGHDKLHKPRLNKITNLQKERLNVLLNYKDTLWLDSIENQIATESVEVIKSRIEFIKILEENFQNNVSHFLYPKIAIEGEVERIFFNTSEEFAVLDIMDLLKNNRSYDKENWTTSFGVFKTYWKVLHPKNNLDAAQSSAGEQKAFLISLILAAAKIYKSIRKSVPILLLDDLMVHLDENRRKNLLKEIKSLDIQTFFTGTDLSFFEHIKAEAEIFKVEKSVVSRFKN